MPIGASAGAVLDAADADAQVVYLCGPRPAEGWRAWAYAGLGDRWAPGLHYLENAAAPVLRYTSAAGRQVEVHAGREWFGDLEPADAGRAASAWEQLGVLVRRAFAGGVLMNTPATTGRDLFLRSIAHGAEWPVLSDEVQQLIRATDGQGRIEVLAPPSGWPRQCRSLYEYDGRLMYAALCWGLPAGEPTRDHLDVFAGQTRGRYRVDARVPACWPQTFGLLGVKDAGGGWRYPAAPRETFTTWCDGAELALALEHGWEVTIRERLLFPTVRGKGPLDAWAAKLRQLRAQVGALIHANPTPERVHEAELIYAAVRNLILHGIGAFHGREHLVTRSLPIDQAAEVPAGAANVRVEGDWISWGERTGQGWANMAHPEWSAAIWARARARLLQGPAGSGALHRAPGTEVVAFRTDAIYLTGRQDWPDEPNSAGEPQAGRLRLVRQLTSPAPWPASNSELLALRRSMAATADRG